MSRRTSRLIATTALAVALILAASAPPAGASAMKLWWDTFEDANTNMWTFAPLAGVTVAVDNTTANTGAWSLKVVGNSGANQGVQAWSRALPIDFDYDYTVQFAFKYTSFHWDRILIFGHIRLLLDYPHLAMLYDPVGNNSFAGNRLGNAFNTYLPAGTWGWITVHCRPSLNQYTVFINGTKVGTVNYQVTVTPSKQLFWEDNFSVNNYLNAWFDDFSVWGMQGPLLGDGTGVNYCNPGFMGGADPENTMAWAQAPDVPWHSQYNWTAADPDISQLLAEPCSPPMAGQQNGRCMVAGLTMIFDRFENLPAANVPPNPQEEIAAAANTSDRPNINNATGGPGNWFGTYTTDCRRAAHFSSATQALTLTRAGCPPFGRPGGPGAAGYTWRSLGYSAVDSVWTDLAPDDTVDVATGISPWVFETFLASGYPIIIHFPTIPDDYCDHLVADAYEGMKDANCNLETTVSGHAVVVIGFDNIGGNQGNLIPGPAFLLHDPGVGKYLWIDAQYFWDTLWTGKGFVFAAPWELQWLSPPQWGYQCKFDGTLLVTYPGPKPLNGFFPVGNAQANVTLSMIGFQGGEVATHNLANLVNTGDWDFSTWKLNIKPKPPCQGPCLVQGGVSYSAWGTLNPAAASHSYANYADKLGGSGQETKWLSGSCALLVDAGHANWPYSGRWWNDGESGGSSLGIIDISDPVVGLTAFVRNLGTDPIPPGAVCRFYFSDPTMAEQGSGGIYIGEVAVPPLASEDTLTVGPLPWTVPPENGFGEPHFSLRAELVVTGDTGTSLWPQDENNHAVLAHFQSEALPARAESLHVALVNPETTPMYVQVDVEKDTGAAPWSVVLYDPDGDVIPQGVLLPMVGSDSLTMRVEVTPTPGDTVASVHVISTLYTTGSALVRETGGITWTLHIPASAADAGPIDATGSPRLFLAQNMPNPFQGVTVIRYSLPRTAPVQLQVFDVMGRLVRTLVSAEEVAGWHEARWNGADNRGATVARGLYFYRLEVAGRAQLTRKLLFLR